MQYEEYSRNQNVVKGIFKNTFKKLNDCFIFKSH